MNYFENLKTENEIKETYKKLARTYHPDVYGEKGNDILKDIHNQLEKALKNIDKKAYNNLYNGNDKEESEEIRAKKEQIARELSEKYKGFAHHYLFVVYWQNGLRPANHRNPLTKHNFTGWNVWQLELKMLLEGYTSSEWSTFAQYSSNDNSIIKGQKGCYITLAIVSKSKNKDSEEDETSKVYYKGYTVFNYEQTNKAGKEKQPKQIAKVKQLPAKKEVQTEQKKLDLWQEKYETVA